MGLHEQLAKKVEVKEREIRLWREEISVLEGKISEAEGYIRGIQETLRLLPRDGTNGPRTAGVVLRPGSDVAKAADAIRTLGHAIHIKDLVSLIGKEDTKMNRAALAGSLSAYVRQGNLFARTAPNTFGLRELGHIDGGDEEGSMD